MEQAPVRAAGDDALDGEDVRITADGVQDKARELPAAASASPPPDRVENADS